MGATISLAGGQGALVNANINRTTEAYVGTRAGTTPGDLTTLTLGTDDLKIEASSKFTAKATPQSLGVSVANVSALVANATIGGMTRAYVGQATTVTAGNLYVSTMAEDGATATFDAAAFGGVFNCSKLWANATVNGTVESFIGTPFGQAPDTGTTTQLTIDGRLEVDAKSSMTAEATAWGSGGSWASNRSDLLADATATGTTRAFVGEGTDVTANRLSVGATAELLKAKAETFVVGIGLGGSGAGARATSDVDGTVEAFIGPESGTTASANPVVLSITSGIDVLATTTRAAADANGTAGSGGTLSSGARFEALAEVGKDDLVEDDLDVSDELVTRAFIGNGTIINKAGGVNVSTTAAHFGSATAIAGSGSVFYNKQAGLSKTVVKPIVESYIGEDVSIHATGDVNVLATSQAAEADATSKAYGGGAVNVGSANASLETSPTITSYIGDGATVVTTGNVKVRSVSDTADTAGKELDDFFETDGVNTDNDTIQFEKHGLDDGGAVVYDPNGNPPIRTGDPASGDALGSIIPFVGEVNNETGKPGADGKNDVTYREYSALVVDENTIKLGWSFDGGTGLDPLQDVIRFAGPHRFETGDAVRLDVQDILAGSNTLVPGFDATQPLFVIKIDETTIKLAATKNQAQTEVTSLPALAPSNVTDADETITIMGNSFENGQPVTYLAPAPNEFTVNDVVDDVITIKDHGFSAGDAVVYWTNRTDTNGDGSLDGSEIGGLSEGQTYYVVDDGELTLDTFKLASTLGDALGNPNTNPPVPPSPLTLTPVENDNVLHLLRKEANGPIGGLVEGRTYYVDDDPSDGTFKLSSTDPINDSTTPVDLSTTDLDPSAVHRLGTRGLDLLSASGRHEVRIDLATQPDAGTQHKLLGGGAISLRIIAPLPGNGMSSATATGGGGGLGAFDSPKANATSNPVVKAYVNGDRVEAGGDIEISTLSKGNISTYASNASGGLLKVDKATSTLTYGDINNPAFVTNAAFVGRDEGSDLDDVDANGVDIVAGGQFRINADTQIVAHASSRADGGGGIAITESRSTAKVNSKTMAVVGDGARHRGPLGRYPLESLQRGCDHESLGPRDRLCPRQSDSQRNDHGRINRQVAADGYVFFEHGRSGR